MTALSPMTVFYSLLNIGVSLSVAPPTNTCADAHNGEDQEEDEADHIRPGQT